MPSEIIIDILYKRLTGGKLTADESDILEKWIDENADSRCPLIDKMSDIGSIISDYRLREKIDSYRPYREMCERLHISELESENDSMSPEVASEREKEECVRESIKPYGFRFLKYAAAIVVVVIPVLFLFLSRPSGSASEPLSKNTTVIAEGRRIILEQLSPGSSQAVMKLPDGDTIHLGEPDNGSIAAMGKTAEGTLQLEVPRGGEFFVILEDSTKVWLNSESRLNYPSHFSMTERKVELIGEAYFVVSHQTERPFTVESEGQKVTVYGTEFNIRSYPEDKAVYTTLSEGSIGLSRIDGNGGEIRLSPGKQAVFNKESSTARVRQVDIERVTGWRHGRFIFEESTLLQIMRDLSRWYDFDFEFADEEAAETIFMGSIPRYSNFKTAIAILEKSGGLIFSVKDNKVVISKE